ncbi:MAG: hypothetical protein OEZ48_02720 [Candidatus Bathyarchaeota archaeon]|nr:hypothetical protein [Candidatus Bathyarchaeota archaeon]MDH5686766.1 hypothetical protein [Candidatus Bathyarchaeota archaeon]
MFGVFLIDLFSTFLEFFDSVLVSAGVFLVVSPYFGMVLVTDLNSVVKIISAYWINMSYFDIKTAGRVTDATVTVTPEKTSESVLSAETLLRCYVAAPPS